MGSKQALSNGNEPEELTDLLRAFEQQNGVEISLCWKVAKRHNKPDLLVSGTAVVGNSSSLGQKCLGSANAICWGSEFKSLMGLVTTLLYRLDFVLAEREFAGKLKAE